jgi:hypothetical protein
MKNKSRSLSVIFAVSLGILTTCPRTALGFLQENLAGQRRLEKRNPDIRKIEKALAAVKRNRAKVVAMSSAVTSRGNRSLAQSFPDVCSSPSPLSAPAVPIPYPNTALASDMPSGSKKVKVDAERAGATVKESNFKKSEGDEIGASVKRLEAKVGKILAGRSLNAEEKRLFRKEWTDSVERARQLAKDLDQYVLDVEKILKEAKKELGIKIPL